MTFEPCNDMQCSGCHRVDEIRHDDDGFLSATTYSGEYCTLTLPTVDMFTDPMTYVLFLVGKVPAWTSVVIHVGDGSLDEALSEGDEGRQFAFFECFETEDAEEQHNMVVDSTALTTMDNRMTSKEMVDRFRDKYFGDGDDMMDMFG
jgi:hypothetical protein